MQLHQHRNFVLLVFQSKTEMNVIFFVTNLEEHEVTFLLRNTVIQGCTFSYAAFGCKACPARQVRWIHAISGPVRWTESAAKI